MFKRLWPKPFGSKLFGSLLFFAPAIMVTLETSHCYPLRSPLLGDSILPVHHWVGADPSCAFFLEQQYWLHYSGYKNMVDYRKLSAPSQQLGDVVRDLPVPIDEGDRRR